MIRVLVADDHTLVRSGLRLLLEDLPGIQVVGEAADGAETLLRMSELHPDVVLMDIAMPGLNGLEALRRARREHPESRILMLSMHSAEAYVQEAMRAGAAGFILKGSDRGELESALNAVARGETWITPRVSAAVLNALEERGTDDPLALLTSRQREILQLVAEGRTTKQIAHRLGISPKTVEAHRAAIMDRIGIRDLAGLVRFALRTGLTSGDGSPR